MCTRMSLTCIKKGILSVNVLSFISYKGECGVDDGGLQRDMFSAFWEEA